MQQHPLAGCEALRPASPCHSSLAAEQIRHVLPLHQAVGSTNFVVARPKRTSAMTASACANNFCWLGFSWPHVCASRSAFSYLTSDR